MKSTFFDYLGIAHLEKIHSQTISWILSNDNNGLNKVEKQKIIAEFFDIVDFEVKENITEYNNIDIVLISDDTIICVENKLSSSVHSQQLEKYHENIEKEFPLLTKKYFLLSLISENAKNANWQKLSYSDLLQALKKTEIKDNNNGTIILEYIETLENFQSVIKDFIQKPQDYFNVFKDGNKKKSQKLLDKNLGTKQNFVRKNQLETIFQKLYFGTVINRLKLKNHYIFETRGNAVLATTIHRKYNFKDKLLDFGFSYQNGTFKIFCTANDYENSNIDYIPREIIEILINLKNKRNYSRLNKPKSKGQISMTKIKKELLGIEIDEFSEIYKKEFEEASKIIDDKIIYIIENR